ncbi:DUF4145 domain-containing protein [Trabulsiella odontotermitis]|uniref:DUF4145 domain-containing protein n=1 Tax=Trabulsiella odontotermitis TaxID=379893 RepID=UPI000675C52B|nr:DUF4145 domain-containing protein [Trabulsiella odontotermitis]
MIDFVHTGQIQPFPVLSGTSPTEINKFLNRLGYQIGQTKMSAPDHEFPAHTIDISRVGTNLRPSFEIEKIYPGGESAIPDNLPSQIERMYKEDLMAVRGSARHTIISCRTILESACKQILEVKNKKLIAMIDTLKNDGLIPSTMADWAHTIRIIGNDAVHEDESPGIDEASEIVAFTDNLLQLLFTYPARIEKIREQLPSKFPVK